MSGNIRQWSIVSDIRNTPHPVRMFHIGPGPKHDRLDHRQPAVDRGDSQSQALSGFLFPAEKNDQHHQQQAVYLGFRYWPWYVYSGWWFGIKGQYKDFATSGIWRPALNTGSSVGAGLSAGYTFLLHERLNLDFGIGAWGGRMLKHTLYECPVCLDIRETGPKWFAGIDEISISIIYIFGKKQ